MFPFRELPPVTFLICIPFQWFAFVLFAALENPHVVLCCVPLNTSDHVLDSSFKVVFLDLSARLGEPIPPPPPSKEFPPLEKSRRSSTHRFKRIQVKSFLCSSEPRNLPWSRPSDPGQPTPGVLDQPYKRAFVDEAGKAHGGGRGSRGPGGPRAGRGGRKSPKSVAWRRETSSPRVRPGGRAGRGRGAKRADGSLIGAADHDPLRRAAAGEGKHRRSPFPATSRPDTRSSMCISCTSTGRSQRCRVLL